MNSWKDDLQVILDQDPHNLFAKNTARHVYDDLPVRMAMKHNSLSWAKQELVDIYKEVSVYPFQKQVVKNYILDKIDDFLVKY